MFKIGFGVLYFINMILACYQEYNGHIDRATYDMAWAILLYLCYRNEK